MVSVNFKLAILTVLAKWPERRATVDEVRREVGVIIANEDQAEQLRRLFALGDIDIFQTGLVSRNEEGFQITDAGLSLLQSLESSSAPSPGVSSPPIRLIDDLIGTQERLKIFDLELRTLDNMAFDAKENDPAALVLRPPIGAESQPKRVDSEASDAGEGGHDDQPVQGEENQPVLLDPPSGASPDVPAFLRRSFGSRGQDSARRSLELATLLAFIAEKNRFIASAWRRLFSETLLIEKTERFVGSVGGAAFALLSLLVAVTCVGAAIALGQIKSLKSDVSLLHREFLSLRERLAKSEQAEKAKRDLDQEEIKAEKSKPGGEIRADQTALNLSREEIQLIKDYIKPAPSAGAAAATINVGDLVEGGMIPLPSALTDKVPKLAGGKFTIRNGAIVIVKRDSRQADAVLAPN